MVEINNLTAFRIKKSFFAEAARIVLSGEGGKIDKKRGGDLSIAFVGPARIREQNRIYRKKNSTTDVLSFSEKGNSKTGFCGGGLGEIIICPSQVKKNARILKTPFEKELTLCLIHGILHILGLDHERSKKEKNQMEQKQNYYLGKIFKN